MCWGSFLLGLITMPLLWYAAIFIAICLPDHREETRRIDGLAK